MNKVVLAIIAIVCLGLIGPKVVGTVVEKEYDNIAQLMKENPSIEITERTFTSHWFTGQAKTKINIKGISPSTEKFQLIITEKLTFGPFIFAGEKVMFALSHSDADFNFDISTAKPQDQEKLTAFTDKLNDNLTLSSILSYGLNYITTLKVAEMAINEDDVQIKFGAIDSEFTLSDEKYINGFLNWSGLEFTAPDVNVKLSGIDSTFDQEIFSGNFYTGNSLATGEFSMLMKNLTAQNQKDKTIFEIENITLTADTQIENSLMNIGFNYGADKITTEEQTFEKLNMDFSVNKLDPNVLVELNELFTEISQDPEQAALYAQQLIHSAAKLLENNPEFNIDDFSVITPDGTIKMDLRLAVDNSLFDPANPMSILPALKTEAKGVAPYLFFQKLGLESMVNMYIEQGFVNQKADELSFSAQFKHGQLTLNGKTIAL